MKLITIECPVCKKVWVDIMRDYAEQFEYHGFIPIPEFYCSVCYSLCETSIKGEGE